MCGEVDWDSLVLEVFFTELLVLAELCVASVVMVGVVLCMVEEATVLTVGVENDVVCEVEEEELEMMGFGLLAGFVSVNEVRSTLPNTS